MRYYYVPAKPVMLAFCLFTCCHAYAQQGVVHGVIHTKDGEPAAYISVQLKDRKIGTVTDEKGVFVLNELLEGQYTIVITGEGFQQLSRQITVKDQGITMLSVQLDIGARELADVTVGAHGKSYVSFTSSSLMRFNLPTRDIPQSVQIITKQVLLDRQVLSISEAVKSAGGVNATLTPQSNSYAQRGFAALANNFAYDGTKYDNLDQAVQEPFYNVEQVEIIKGPASAIFGDAEPGGLINIVTKKPKESFRLESDFTYGSFGRLRGMIDMSGPISSTKKILYRLIVGYGAAGAMDVNQHNRDIFFSPQIEYHLSDRSMFNYSFEYYYLQNTAEGSLGVPAIFDSVTGKWNLHYYPPNLSLTSSDAYFHQQKFINSLRYTHKFSNRLSFTTLLLGIGLLKQQTGMDYNGPQDYTIMHDSVPESNFIGKVNNFSLQSTSFCTSVFQTGQVTHHLVIGIDAFFQKETYINAQLEQRAVNVLHPDFSWARFNYADAYQHVDQYESFKIKASPAKTGIYLQDLISVGTHWKLLLGGRADYRFAAVNFYFPVTVLGLRDTTKSFNINPRAGIVYQLRQKCSVYASFMRGFDPEPYGYQRQGGPFPPEKSTQYETGLRVELPNQRFVMSVAAYHIRKFNVVVIGDSNLLKLDHQVISKGLEFSAQGTLLKNLDVIFNYSLNFTNTSGDVGINNYPPGRFPGAPEHNVNVWTKYSLTRGKLKGLGMGAGFIYLSNQTTSVVGFMVPAYSTVEVGLSYVVNRLRLAVNAYNLTNAKYFSGATGPLSLYPGEPLNFRININYLIDWKTRPLEKGPGIDYRTSQH